MIQSSTGDLLIEFLTEELPPINLEKNIGETFAINLQEELKNFISEESKIGFFITPRRFACIIKQITANTKEQHILRKGPSIDSGLKDGEPTKALLGFVKSVGVDSWKDLEQKEDGYFYAKKIISGQTLANILPQAIESALKNLPIAKNMRWGNNDYHFVRPTHNLIILLNNELICTDCKILGLSPVDYTYGHRIMSNGKIKIENANSYSKQLYEEGKVVADFATRKNTIITELNKKAAELGLIINDINSLIDEVTALVEYPVILQGEFDKNFLKVPQECLILSMAKNQKYFAMLDQNKKLSNKFLFVANIDSTNPKVIVQGNQKVLAARLSDAKFFYEVDLKHDLDYFVNKLKPMVYHNKLGSQFERITRMEKIASSFASLLGIDVSLAKKTAKLLKADLTTEMVGEFPELQGIMGKYYAKAFGESDEIANAIDKHYYPRFSGDDLPDTPLATVMSLTDKLETLVGIWGIGLIPTGEKDPFALRRAALGVVRILLINGIQLEKLLELTILCFDKYNLNQNTYTDLRQFIIQRLSNYLTQVEGYPVNLVQSVIAPSSFLFNQLPSLLKSLQEFANHEENKLLLNANKRISNILEKNLVDPTKSMKPVPTLFTTDEEKSLYKLFMEEENNIQKYINEQDWGKFFAILAKFNQPVTDFFDNVMVMDKDDNIRNNRIALLQQLYDKFNQVCKLAELAK